MREFSIRSSQLKKYKRKLLLKNIFLFIVFFGLSLFFMIMYSYGFIMIRNNKKALPFLEFLYYNNAIIIIIYIILLILIALSIIACVFILKKDNNLYHTQYLNYIFEECKLNDIHFQFRKKTFDRALFEELEALLSINSIDIIYSISDISPTRIIEFNQVKYLKNNNQVGVIILSKVEDKLDGFLQIRSVGEPNITNYENKSILRFGFQKTLSKYEIYSSLGSSTYSIDNENFIKLLDEFSKFVRCNFVITRTKSTISILLETFQFNLTSSVLKISKIDELDNRVEAMIRLHNLTDDIINSLLRLKI